MRCFDRSPNLHLDRLLLKERLTFAPPSPPSLVSRAPTTPVQAPARREDSASTRHGCHCHRAGRAFGPDHADVVLILALIGMILMWCVEEARESASSWGENDEQGNASHNQKPFINDYDATPLRPLCIPSACPSSPTALLASPSLIFRFSCRPFLSAHGNGRGCAVRAPLPLSCVLGMQNVVHPFSPALLCLDFAVYFAHKPQRRSPPDRPEHEEECPAHAEHVSEKEARL